MKVSVLILILAMTILFLSLIPRAPRAWMIGVGLALFAFSFLPFLDIRIGQ